VSIVSRRQSKAQLNSQRTTQEQQLSFIGDFSRPYALLLMVLLASLLAIMFALLKSGLQNFDWVLLGMSGMFTIWCVLGAAAILQSLKPVFTKMTATVTAGISFVVCLAWVACVTVLGQWFANGGLRGNVWLVDGWALAETLVVASVLLGVGMRYAYLSLQYRLREQSSLYARLDALHARIRPHFLFNTLNSISSLISVAPDNAEQAVEDLAALFRANLQSGMSLVRWAEERDLCERYLRIERARLADRLQVDWQDTGIDDDVSVPSLLLQPLIENAIAHGIQLLQAGGVVTITAAARDGMINIEIQNPVLASSDLGVGNGMASDNVRLRLQTLFGDEASFKCQLLEGYYRVSVVFPIRKFSPGLSV
jgi:two-component system sensor histidine kinase AlgZ